MTCPEPEAPGRTEMRLRMSTADLATLRATAGRMNPPMRPMQLLACLLTGGLALLEGRVGDVSGDELRALAAAFGADPDRQTALPVPDA